ncbi:MAG TPA: Asp-tRNA(Asn)/Glu-tRNA(Gln) amidotransferase subunit GatB [Candidatus Saccharibacteria bacterium]|nr:Asp-tRNA(Asn)/Glu-tRNA(Gln) amidotransferase subunit GatB [Candidatus Saccharibacteria bacterium]
MISDDVKKQYTVTIGIECHVQLKTKSKLFASESNEARDLLPNTAVGHVSFGMPGALPVLNKKAVELAVRAAFALNTEPQKFSKFDRKHYFYPDLPKGYQISQFEEPIILGGYVDIFIEGEAKRINITRAHMEEDAGKSTHPTGKDYSLVDLNRAGTPLLEIVSEPEIHSAAEARAYAKALYLQMKYADVSDADLYQGNMRFDVNVSVSKDPKVLGTRSETKNLNSFRSVEKAVEYEINRQIELLEKGEEIVQETRGWDDAKQKTISQRTKEDAHDYRYMPEPDVPPIVLTDEYVNSIKQQVPVMPSHLRQQLSVTRLQSSQIETLIEEPELAYFVVGLIDDVATAKTIANWLTGDITKLVSDNVFTWSQVVKKKNGLVKLAHMVNNRELSSTSAKSLLTNVVEGKDPEELAKENHLLQVSDEGAIEKIVSEVIAENEKAAEDVKKGEMKAIGFLVGQVMAKSKGQANPGLAQKIIKKQLGQ